MLVSAGMFFLRAGAVAAQGVQLDIGGVDVDDSLPEAALISAGSTDYVLRKAMPKSFTDDQLRRSTFRYWR